MIKIFLPLVLFVVVFAGNARVQDTLRVAMLPVWAPEITVKRINALAGYLTEKLGQPVEPVVHTNFSAYMGAVKGGDIDIAYSAPVHYTKFSKGHEVVAMAVGGRWRDRLRGAIVVRSDSGIDSLEDLKGKRVGYNGPNAAGAAWSQILTLRKAGINEKKDIELVRAVNSKQANTLYSLYLGEIDAGFVRDTSVKMLEKYIAQSQLKILANTKWLPNWGLSVKRTLPDRTRKAVQEAMVGLKEGAPVLKAMGLDGMRAADDSDYEVIRTATSAN